MTQQDIDRYRVIIDSLKTALELSDFVSRWKDKTIEALQEENLCYKRIVSN